MRTVRFIVLGLSILLVASARADDEIAFCQALVSKGVSEEYEWELANNRLNGNLMVRVRIKQLSVEDQQRLIAKYRNHPPHPRPVAVFRCSPMIPFNMRKQRIEGKADCYLIVSKDGTVIDVYLAGCTSASYAQAFGLSLKAWRFQKLDEECLIIVPMAIHLTSYNAQSPAGG